MQLPLSEPRDRFGPRPGIQQQRGRLRQEPEQDPMKAQDAEVAKGLDCGRDSPCSRSAAAIPMRAPGVIGFSKFFIS